MASPLLFATLGALCSEYAGVLAVFMDGAITFSGFVCIAITGLTGNAPTGFVAAAGITILLLFLIAQFTERTRANPFITGLSVNLFAAGITSWLSASIYKTRGVITLASLGVSTGFTGKLAFPAAVLTALILAVVLHFTGFGLNLRISGSSGEVLTARGISPARYRTISWCIAAFLAACAGSVLALRLGAFVPNLSAGRGWTALAAVYLGYRNPLLCVLAVFVFSAAEYITNIMQGTGHLPGTLILGLPYALALLVFILIPRKK